MSSKRKLKYHIGSAEAGSTIRAFLSERLGFSSHQISRLKYQQEGISVDGSKAYVNHILREGEFLEIGLTEQVLRRDTEGGRPAKIWLAPSSSLARYPLSVLYEDEDLLIVNKPAGIVCHPSPGHYADTLANQAVAHLGGSGTAMDVRVTGRLDRETSGIVTFAKNTEAAGMIQRQRDRGLLYKTYLALAEGRFVEKEGVIDAPLRREYPGSHKMVTAEDGKAARTFYRVLGTLDLHSAALKTAGEQTNYPVEAEKRWPDEKETEERTLLACRIEHGRTHQIRVHLASIGHPLVGDPLYGIEKNYGREAGHKREADYVDRKKSLQKSLQGAEERCCEVPADLPKASEREEIMLGLHAWKLSLRQPFTGEKIEVEAPAPAWAKMTFWKAWSPVTFSDLGEKGVSRV